MPGSREASRFPDTASCSFGCATDRLSMDLFSLKGKNALVTGSRTGLGKGLAFSLAEAGANVVIHGSKAEGLDEACSEVRAAGVKAVRAIADLSQPDSCEGL